MCIEKIYYSLLFRDRIAADATRITNVWENFPSCITALVITGWIRDMFETSMMGMHFGIVYFGLLRLYYEIVLSLSVAMVK